MVSDSPTESEDSGTSDLENVDGDGVVSHAEEHNGLHHDINGAAAESTNGSSAHVSKTPANSAYTEDGSTGEKSATRGDQLPFPLEEKIAPTKRRRCSDASNPPTNKKPKTHRNENYRDLLNREIEEAVKKTGPSDDLPGLEASQLGASYWTADEKNTFYNSLMRLGRHNLHGIAAAIPTKSEMEIHQYIMLLQQGVTEYRHQGPGLTEIPAALEISPECCKFLDTAGNALSTSQWAIESAQAKAKYGRFWLLDWQIAEEVDSRLQEEEHKGQIDGMLTAGSGNAQPKTVDALPLALCFLNLSNWLELSELVFMNPSTPRLDENWQSLATSKDEKPSIMYTAFSDFHNLMVSITKRLVQACLFFATSRLRARPGKATVKRIDVHAALKILHMRESSKDFWVSVPRRCNLDVYPSGRIHKYRNIRSVKKLGERIPYDKLEVLLSASTSYDSQLNSGEESDREESCPSEHPGQTQDRESVDGSNSEDTSRQNSDSEPEPNSNDANDTAQDDHSDDLSATSADIMQLEGPINPSDSEFEKYKTSASKRKRDRLRHEGELHQYTEAFDQHGSWVEEQRLWALLGQEPPSSVKHEDMDLPKRPARERREASHLEDWTIWTDRESEWERFEGLVPEPAFRKQKKINRQTSITAPLQALGSTAQDKAVDPHKTSAPLRPGMTGESGPDASTQQTGSAYSDTTDTARDSDDNTADSDAN